MWTLLRSRNRGEEGERRERGDGERRSRRGNYRRLSRPAPAVQPPDKHTERNIPAAVGSMLTIVTLTATFVEPRWLILRGGGCNVDVLGVNDFFRLGKVQRVNMYYIFHYGTPDALVNCVSDRVVAIMRGVIAMLFVACGTSLAAFLLDLTGPSHSVLRLLRRNSVFSVFTVLLCVMVNALVFWASQNIYTLQVNTKIHTGSRVSVTYGVSYYLVVAAGGLAIVTSAMNLLKRHPPGSWLDAHATSARDRESLEGLMGNEGSAPDTLAPLGPPDTPHPAPAEDEPPPPEYTP